MASSNSRGLVLLLITSGFFITGLLFDYMPMIVDDHIKRTVELATNDEILSYWSRPPVDIHSYYWVYSVTNADSRMEKRIIEISSNKYRVIYNSSRIMRLNESYPGSEQLDEQITLLNPIYGSICEGARAGFIDVDPQQRTMMASSINRLTERFNETLFLNTSARVALLGRSLPIIQTVKKLADTFGLDAKVPDILPNGKFGFVAVQNDTQSGPFEIYTGYKETAKSLGELISYKGKRRMSYYDGRCNRLQASVGELRPMPIDPSQVLEMYSPMFCRIAHLKPTGMHKLREGLAVSYVVASEDFMSADTNPDNRCYCINGTADNYCSLNGAIELAPCSYYSPVVLTVGNIQPDPKITGSIQNWDPDLLRSDIESLPSNEMTQILILKRLGVPVFADLTATLFMKITRDPMFKQTVSVPEISYIPLVMVRETASIPPRLGQIIVNLESFLALTYHIKVIMYLSSVVLLCWLTGYYYCRTSQSERIVPVRQMRSGSRSNGGGAAGPGVAAISGNLGGPDPNQAGGGGGASGGVAGNLSSSTNGAADGLGTAGDRRASKQLVNGQQRVANGRTLSNSLVEQIDVSKKNNNNNNNNKDPGENIGQQQRQQQAPDTTSSERANSADSNRSQPPSRRTSQLGSLEVGTSSQEDEAPPTAATRSAVSGGKSRLNDGRQVTSPVGNENNEHVIARQPTTRMRREPSIGAANSTTRSYPIGRRSSGKLMGPNEGEPARPQVAGVRPIGVARIFSKVDEELNRLTGNSKQQQQQQENVTNPNGSNSGGANTKIGLNTSEPVGTTPDENQFNETFTGQEQQQLEQQQQQQRLEQLEQSGPDDQGLDAATMLARKRSRKNWFMNVYSNFVRMLNGLRTTISDAGQLDVGENDYQDKQLEMLAGKIDNWYNGQPSPSSNGETNGDQHQQQQQQQQQQQSDFEPTPSLAEDLNGNNSSTNFGAGGMTPMPEVVGNPTEPVARDNQQRQRRQAPSDLQAAFSGPDKLRLVEEGLEESQVTASLVVGEGNDSQQQQQQQQPQRTTKTIGKTMVASTMTEIEPPPSNSEPKTTDQGSDATSGPMARLMDANVGVSSGEFNENEGDTTSVAAQLGSTVGSLERNRSLESLANDAQGLETGKRLQMEPTTTTYRDDTNSRSDDMTSANEAEAETELGPEDLQAEANSKASALERIEAALNNGADGAIAGLEGQSNLTMAPGVGVGVEESVSAGPISVNADDFQNNNNNNDDGTGEMTTTTTTTTTRINKPVMINSSTSIDSVINLAAMSALDVSSKISTGAAAGGGLLLNQSATPQQQQPNETMADDQIDESSSGQKGSLKQSDKWAQDRVVGGDETNEGQSAANGLTFGDQQKPVNGFNVESGHETTITTNGAIEQSNTTTTTSTKTNNNDLNGKSNVSSNVSEEKSSLSNGQQAASTDMNSTITKADDDVADDHDDNQEGTTTTVTTAATTATNTTTTINGKDERRDSGVKLDSRNGISNGQLLAGEPANDNCGQHENQLIAAPAPSTNSTQTTRGTSTQTGAKGNQENGSSTGNGCVDQLNKTSSNGGGGGGGGLAAQSSGRKSPPKSDQQQLKKQIKGIPSSNGNGTNASNATLFGGSNGGPRGGQQINGGNRAKLPPNDGPNYNNNNNNNNATSNSNGNNILNGKIMFQQRNGITSSSNQMASSNETGNRLQPAGA